MTKSLVARATCLGDVLGLVREVDERWLGTSRRGGDPPLLWCTTTLELLCTEAKTSGFLDALVRESTVLSRNLPMKRAWWVGCNVTFAYRQYRRGTADAMMNIYRTLTGLDALRDYDLFCETISIAREKEDAMTLERLFRFAHGLRNVDYEFGRKVSSAILDFAAGAGSLPPSMDTVVLLAAKCLRSTSSHHIDDAGASKLLAVAEITRCGKSRNKLLRTASSYGVKCWSIHKDDVSSLNKSKEFMTRCGTVLLDTGSHVVPSVTSTVGFTLERWLKDCPPNMLDEESDARTIYCRVAKVYFDLGRTSWSQVASVVLGRPCCSEGAQQGLVRDPWAECFAWFWDFVLAKPLKSIVLEGVLRVMASDAWAACPYRVQLDTHVAEGLRILRQFECDVKTIASTVLLVLSATTAPATCRAFVDVMIADEFWSSRVYHAFSSRSRRDALKKRCTEDPGHSCVLVPSMALMERRFLRAPFAHYFREDCYPESPVFVHQLVSTACPCALSRRVVQDVFALQAAPALLWYDSTRFAWMCAVARSILSKSMQGVPCGPFGSSK